MLAAAATTAQAQSQAPAPAAPAPASSASSAPSSVPAASVGSPERSRGSMAGVVTAAPQWSIGAQIGNYAGTGFTFERTAFYDGALDLAIGFDHRSVAISGDYLWLLDRNLDPRQLSDRATYNDLRGSVTPYVGVGLGAGEGLWLRVPIGVQYTMLRDPFNFFGGMTVLVGNIHDDDDVDIGLGVVAGVRVLM
jgi:hypothetical protein